MNSSAISFKSMLDREYRLGTVRSEIGNKSRIVEDPPDTNSCSGSTGPGQSEVLHLGLPCVCMSPSTCTYGIQV